MRGPVLLTWMAALVLAGCATGPVVYPAYKSVPTVAVSATTLSTMTETPAGDHLIDNSQIFVRGSSPGNVAAMFGPLGAALSIAASRSNNAAAVSTVETRLAIKFDQDLNESLQRMIFKPPFNGQVQLQAPDTKADLLLLPYAVLEIVPQNKVRLIFQITARFTSAENSSQRKTYVYVTTFYGPPESLIENENQKFKELSRVAFDRLNTTLFNDLAGQYKNLIAADKPRMTSWQLSANEPLVAGIFLEETPDYHVVMNLWQERPLTNFLLLIDNQFIKNKVQ